MRIVTNPVPSYNGNTIGFDSIGIGLTTIGTTNSFVIVLIDFRYFSTTVFVKSVFSSFTCITYESSTYFIISLDDGMVDVRDLKSLEHYVRVGSSPIRGTIKLLIHKLLLNIL